MVAAASVSAFATGKAVDRLSVKVARHRLDGAMVAAGAAGIAEAGQLVRGIIGLVADDFGIEPCPCGADTATNRKDAWARTESVKMMARTV